MMRTVLGGCVAVLVGLASAGSLEAYWDHPWYGGRSYAVSYYYYPAPVVRYYYYAPAYVVLAPYCPPAVVQPVPVYNPVYANPQPAPPSQFKEPPMGQAGPGAPKVIESRMQAINETTMVKSAEAGGKDVCKVGFWNISKADVKIVIDGKMHVIPRDRNLTLVVGREFTYQVNAEAPRTERVPDDKATHEIVIR
jgi:hypothetical protein